MVIMGAQRSFGVIAHRISNLHHCPFWLGEDATTAGWAKPQTSHPPMLLSDRQVQISLLDVPAILLPGQGNYITKSLFNTF